MPVSPEIIRGGKYSEGTLAQPSVEVAEWLTGYRERFSTPARRRLTSIPAGVFTE